ncbi:MAG: hypothetical protein H6600_06085 [Flavobacteriales bacterium]|nr:hypothetical protein [Flavobacteriales bacterium]MCB9198012.1 hypothetical protein [Flavobacteriales bacterium]
MKRILLMIMLTMTLIIDAFSQGCECFEDDKKVFFFYWGYNRSAYLRSDLTMHGDGYDYKLHQVVAHDRPEEFDPKVYFNLFKLSIPQFNIRLGYRLNEKWSVSLGYDHMKYVVDTDQNTTITGTIDSSASSEYAGTYDNSPFYLTDHFLHFEHTDGLNFITVELDYVSTLWTSRNKKFWLENRSGVAPGALYPRTDVTVFENKGPNIWNLAGGGIALRSEFRINMWKYFFIQTTAKAGLLFLPRIQTTGVKGEYAKQNIQFLEGYWAVGANFKI